MKTTINLSDYTFGSNPKLLKRQISDDPETGFARVLELQRAELLFDVEMIVLKAFTYFVDFKNQKIISKFTSLTLSNRNPWEIRRGDKTLMLNEDFQPTENPDFNPDTEVSANNYPYLLTDSYEQFAGIILNPVLDLSLAKLWCMFVDTDDAKGLFD